jgi:hypothetical protein
VINNYGTEYEARALNGLEEPLKKKRFNNIKAVIKSEESFMYNLLQAESNPKQKTKSSGKN